MPHHHPDGAPPHGEPRRDEADDAGWTYVKRRHNRGQRRGAGNIEGTETPGPRADNLRPVADIAAEYRSIRSRWDKSAACAALCRLTAAELSSAGAVSQAICLGIGTFDPDDGAWNAKRTSFLQLVAFLSIVQELEAASGANISCIFQEPLFTASDEAFLASLGHRVVGSPEACNMVSNDSLLFAVHLYAPVYAMALRNATPAIFVGTGWDVWDRISRSEGLESIEAMERTHAKRPFPRDDNTNTAFSDTSVFWKSQSHGSAPDDDEDVPEDTAVSDQERTLENAMGRTRLS